MRWCRALACLLPCLRARMHARVCRHTPTIYMLVGRSSSRWHCLRASTHAREHTATSDHDRKLRGRPTGRKGVPPVRCILQARACHTGAIGSIVAGFWPPSCVHACTPDPVIRHARVHAWTHARLHGVRLHGFWQQWCSLWSWTRWCSLNGRLQQHDDFARRGGDGGVYSGRQACIHA